VRTGRDERLVSCSNIGQTYDLVDAVGKQKCLYDLRERW